MTPRQRIPSPSWAGVAQWEARRALEFPPGLNSKTERVSAPCASHRYVWCVRTGRQASNFSAGCTNEAVDRNCPFRGKSVSDAAVTDLPPTVQKADDLDAVVKDAIEGEILTGDQVANAGRDVVPGQAGTWSFSSCCQCASGASRTRSAATKLSAAMSSQIAIRSSSAPSLRLTGRTISLSALMESGAEPAP